MTALSVIRRAGVSGGGMRMGFRTDGLGQMAGFSKLHSSTTPSRTFASLSSRTLRPSPLRRIPAAATIASPASGNSRSLSLWPFGGKPNPPIETAEGASVAAADYSSAPATAGASGSVDPALSVREGSQMAETSSSTTASSGNVQEVISDAATTISADVPHTTFCAIQELANAEIEHGFFGRYFSANAEKFLCYVHDYTMFPWYVSIPCAILMIRFAVLPFQMRGTIQQYKNAKIRPQITDKITEIRAFQSQGNRLAANQAQQEMLALQKKHNFKPLAGLGFPFVQGFVFMSMFFAFKNMGAAGIPSLVHEGTWFFQDLTAAGPWYGLPLVSAALMLTAFETAAESGGAAPGISGTMRWAFRGLIGGSFFLFYDLPSAVFVYWVTNNLFTLCYGTFMRKAPDSVRTLIGLPTKAEQDAQRAEAAKSLPSFLGGPKAVVADAGKPKMGFWDGVKAMQEVADEISQEQNKKGEAPLSSKEMANKLRGEGLERLAKKRQAGPVIIASPVASATTAPLSSSIFEDTPEASLHEETGQTSGRKPKFAAGVRQADVSR